MNLYDVFYKKINFVKGKVNTEENEYLYMNQCINFNDFINIYIDESKEDKMDGEKKLKKSRKSRKIRKSRKNYNSLL